jgi:hypothetical protein
VVASVANDPHVRAAVLNNVAIQQFLEVCRQSVRELICARKKNHYRLLFQHSTNDLSNYLIEVERDEDDISIETKHCNRFCCLESFVFCDIFFIASLLEVVNDSNVIEESACNKINCFLPLIDVVCNVSSVDSLFASPRARQTVDIAARR